MKRYVLTLVLVLVALTGINAELINHDVVFNARVDFDQGVIWRMRNIEVTSTATEFNYLDADGTGFPDSYLSPADLAVASNTIVIGNASGAGVNRTMSGDATMDTNGVVVVSNASTLNVASNTVVIGNASGVGVNRTLTGDVTNDTNGVMSITGGAILNVDVNASAAIDQSKLATAGLGTAITSTTTATEVSSPYVETVITITDVAIVATNGAANGVGQKIFDADVGAFLVGLSVANMQCITLNGATNVFVVAVGTALATAGNAALTGTEANIIPSTSLDTTAGTVLTNAFDAILAAPAILDGTSSAVDLYLNFGIADADMDGDVTNTFSGTLTLLTTRAVNN